MSGLDVEALLESTATTAEATPKQDDIDDRSRADAERRDRDRSQAGREAGAARVTDVALVGIGTKTIAPAAISTVEVDAPIAARGPPVMNGIIVPHVVSVAMMNAALAVIVMAVATPLAGALASPPELNEDERDKRTIFVQQLAARLRTKELMAFFEKVGPVKEAQIVKDRVSGRSKGVGYVEFKSEESVPAAIQLTGQKLLGIPIIAQLTEAEKNRQARNPEASSGPQHSAPFHRLYVGNVHFSITENDLQNVFEPFGELEFVQLQKDETGRSKGYAFVQFRDPNQAREALEKMNGFDLAGRAIRVGLGNDKFTPESNSNRPQGPSANQPSFQGSSFSGHGGRGVQAGGSNNFDRAGGRESEKGAGASALDDTDVAGVNFNNYSRDALMRKLARTDEPEPSADEQQKILRPKTEVKPLPVNVNMASRCVMLRNMFDPSDEEGEAWIKDLEDDVRGECEEKYGHVVHISLDPSSQGDIYLKFDRVQGGENAIKGLNGRFFGGKQITAQPVVDAVYSSLFSRTKAI
ncbi:RNA-binding protein rsd1 [Penicillium angulare]|uniref:RNA-binding protein rsd1 n=1 Tax=Penicillium angulare TaxID=116970 RepID=A0A9W9FAB8_9EURO|nr:RNA-binding protein rsd1 [Penicillium angulare]